MNEQNILQCRNRHEFRQWLMEHHDSETECWVEVRRGRPDDDSVFWYLDAVEEALPAHPCLQRCLLQTA